MKKISICLFMLVAFLLFNEKTYAETMDIESIVAKFPDTFHIKYSNAEVEDDEKLSIVYNDGFLDIYAGTVKTGSMRCKDDYIEYDVRDVEKTELNYKPYYYNSIAVEGILGSAFLVLGLDDFVIDSGSYTDSYDMYGVLKSAEWYLFNRENDLEHDDLDSSMLVNITEYFKMSLDSAKIRNFRTIYGSIPEKDEDGEEWDVVESDEVLDAENVDDVKKEVVDAKNPETGIFVPVFALLVFVASGLLLWLFARRKKCFFKL